MKKFTKMLMASILLLSCSQQFTMDYIKTAGSFLAPAMPNGWSVAAVACIAGHLYAKHNTANKISQRNISAYNLEQTDNFYDENMEPIQTFKINAPIASMVLTVALPYLFPQLQKYTNLGSKITIGTSIAALAMTYGQLQYQKWQNKKNYEKYPETLTNYLQSDYYNNNITVIYNKISLKDCITKLSDENIIKNVFPSSLNSFSNLPKSTLITYCHERTNDYSMYSKYYFDEHKVYAHEYIILNEEVIYQLQEPV